MPDRAVFLDRDGVINVDRGYTHRVDDFQFVAGSAEAMRQLQSAGWRLVVVTNQSGIARGLYSSDDYERFTAHLRTQLQTCGVHLDAVLHCPHLPNATVAAYRLACDCRKPAPGMLLRAARELSLDLAASAIVGDRLSDVEAGRAAGVGRCLLVRSGHPIDPQDAHLADAVFDDLAAAAGALTGPTDVGPR
ncbi:MAG TPA: D-glycero-beta-D-manno-heptose 1,7-bisphosphate 7-phosphatase [Burkholderiaceae bacterium]|nr:D-glycero-beta-D-manno-heptose 1,7-bisphosphate 7-phosphatase [Burkholderiaceae bacterium]